MYAGLQNAPKLWPSFAFLKVIIFQLGKGTGEGGDMVDKLFPDMKDWLMNLKLNCDPLKDAIETTEYIFSFN